MSFKNLLYINKFIMLVKYRTLCLNHVIVIIYKKERNYFLMNYIIRLNRNKMSFMGKGSSACMVLNSYHQGAKYDLKEEKGPPHAREYVYSVTVLGVEYYGTGKNKKEAKQAAAANALSSLHKIKVSLDSGAYSGGGWCVSSCV